MPPPDSRKDQATERSARAAAGMLGWWRLQIRTAAGGSAVRAALSAQAQGPAVQRTRTALTLSRVRIIAALFAALTAAWIPIDLWAFGWQLGAGLAAARLGAGLAFAMLAAAERPPTPAAAQRALGALFVVPMIFFPVANAMLAWSGVDVYHDINWAAAVYGHGPFVLAAGLALFPLTAIESAVAVATIVACAILSEALQRDVRQIALAAGDLWLLTLVAVPAALAALSQTGFIAALTERSARDRLTRLLTREFSLELLEVQFRIAERDDAPLTVIFVDLDRFKAVNDRFGHETGDRVLAGAAAALLATFRRQEVVVRWGGEEFLIVLPNTDEAGARAAIARLAQHGLGLRPDGMPQTASIGLAERRREGAADWGRLIEIADRRMYMAKQAGRNRWIDSENAAAEFIPATVPMAPAA